MKPRVTVGFPVFNAAQYLRQSLDAVLAQDFEDFELLISDNASTDATQEIATEYARRDRRVRYHRNAENLGAARNYNQLVAMAAGEFFRWQTYDDLVAPTHLRRCVEAHTEDPSIALAYPRTVLIDGEGQRIEDYEDRADVRDPRPHRRLSHLLRHIHLCNPVLGLVRLELLRKTRCIGPFRGSDVVLLSELGMLGPIVEIPEPLFFRRRDLELPSPSNLSDDDQSSWYDTQKRGSPFFRTTLFLQHLVSAFRLPLAPLDRVRCGGSVVASWLPPYWRVMGGEFKIALKRSFLRN